MSDKKKENQTSADSQFKTIEIDIKKDKKWIFIAPIVLLALALAALGYYAMSESSKTSDAVSAYKKAGGQLTGCQNDLSGCLNELSGKDKAFNEAKEKVEQLENKLGEVKSRIGELRSEKQSAEQELAELKGFTDRFRGMIDAGKLEVTFRKGRMVVNLPEKVLFASGKAEISEDGLKAIQEVARILRKVKNKRFVVSGHTDNVKISQSKFTSNWELSTARAVGVTSALIKFGLSPQKLVAAGHAQFDPIARNNTEAGRQRNRRIEIMVEPFLKEIPLPKNKKATTKASNAKASTKKAPAKKTASTKKTTKK